MTNGIEELKEALDRAAEGGEVRMEEARSLRFVCSNDQTKRFAEQCWRRLINFVDDVDIRSNDTEYDRQMKEEMLWRADKLASDCDLSA